MYKNILLGTLNYTLLVGSSVYFVYTLIVILFIMLMMVIYKCRNEKYIEKYSIIIFSITATLGFVLYLIGYLANGNGGFISIFRAIFSTARMFVLNDDFSAIGGALKDNYIMNSFWYLPVFWSVHVAALISFTFALLSIFGRKIIEQIVLKLKLGKTIYVIFGVNIKSVCFASSIMAKENRLVIIIDEKTNDMFCEKIRIIGALLIKERILNKGYINDKLLRKIGLLNKYSSKKIELFLFENDETYNISIANAIIKTASRNNLPVNKLRVFLQLNDTMMLRNIEEILDNKLKYELNIVNESDLSARQLMNLYPIFGALDIDTSSATVNNKEVSILIVGFGKIGQQVLLKSICNGQFISKYKETIPFNAIIVDGQWLNKSWKFRNIHPFLEKQYPGIVFKPYSVESEEFFNLIKSKINNTNYIIIATENDYDNLEIAKSIQNFAAANNINWKNKILAVHMSDQSNLLSTDNENIIFRHIKFFGECESIFSEDIIINETMDTIARKVNEHYNYVNKFETNDVNKFDNWNELDLFTKNSNRAVAEHLSTKLALIGYMITNNNIKSDLDKEFKLDENISHEQLENLLRLEHLRWNAYHFVNGWTNFTGEEVELMKKFKGGKLQYKDRKDKSKRRHACLVSWDELASISDIFSYDVICDEDLIEKYDYIKDYQLEDLKQTLVIPEFLGFAEISVVKTLKER